MRYYAFIEQFKRSYELPSFMQKFREKTALWVLQKTQRITHRLPIRLVDPVPSRLLVIAPHMDDEVIAAGGTLARHREIGSKVHIVFCAGGKTDTEDRTRKAESVAVSEFMGFDGIRWLDLPDGYLSHHEKELATKLADIITELNPEQIFCPFVTDHHRDHMATTVALGAAVEQTSWRGQLWCYECWSPHWPNTAIDISDVVATKRASIELYKSQVEGLHYADGALGLNRYRGLRVSRDYAETFFVADTARFKALVDTMNEFGG